VIQLCLLRFYRARTLPKQRTSVLQAAQDTTSYTLQAVHILMAASCPASYTTHAQRHISERRSSASTRQPELLRRANTSRIRPPKRTQRALWPRPAADHAPCSRQQWSSRSYTAPTDRLRHTPPLSAAAAVLPPSPGRHEPPPGAQEARSAPMVVAPGTTAHAIPPVAEAVRLIAHAHDMHDPMRGREPVTIVSQHVATRNDCRQ